MHRLPMTGWLMVSWFLLPFSTLAEEASLSLSQQVEQTIVAKTNEFRQSHDLPQLDVAEHLQKAASEFAQYMAEHDRYGHGADGRTPAERAKAAGYEYCVVRENIAYRTNTGEVTKAGLIEAFVQGWIDSPPHRENMLADYVSETGVSVATTDDVTYYAVQLLGRPKSAQIELKVRNEFSQSRVLIVEANDSVDEIEMPPRSVMTMKRCFPTSLRLAEEEQDVRVNESTQFVITEQGLQRDDKP